MDSLEDGEELLVYCEEELREAYGDGLFVLLQHLAANRQPCFREYMRLKNDGTAEGEDEERWTNLNALEESFVELNPLPRAMTTSSAPPSLPSREAARGRPPEVAVV